MNPAVIETPYPVVNVNETPYPVVNPNLTTGTNPWSTGLFNCFDDADGFIEGAFCGPCQRSRQYNMINNGLNTVHYPSLGIPLFIDFCVSVPVAQIGLTFHLRQEIRRRYRLEGNDLTDLVAAVCCPSLATCQNYREMAARGEWTNGCCASPPVAMVIPAAAPPTIMGAMGDEHAVEGQIVEMKHVPELPPQ